MKPGWAVIAGRVRLWGVLMSGVIAAPLRGQDAPQLPAPLPVRSPVEMERLVAQLDAASYDDRNEASLALAAMGKEAVPHLVSALNARSRELRFRAQELLSHNYPFEDVARHLVQVVPNRYGATALAILKERARGEISATARTGTADQLFKYWHTDLNALHARVMTGLEEAKSADDAARAIAPLLGLSATVRRFNDTMARLESLSLQHDHRYSPGFVVAQTLARGLAESDTDRVEFVEQYVRAFEHLVAALKTQDLPSGGIRKEVADRANMSDGAASYLIGLLDPQSVERRILVNRTQVTPAQLRREFFRGLAAVDSKECYRCVGKTHIADMLTESISQWEILPATDVIKELIERTAGTIPNSDKPKALAYLDALDACRDLQEHDLSVEKGLGNRLARRLCATAVREANNRAYHPARSVHDRLVTLIDMGVVPGDAAFPGKLVELYLQGAPQTTSEKQRFALGRYVQMFERLDAAGVTRDQPGVDRFIFAMRDGLLTRHDLLAAGAAELERQLDGRKQDHAAGQSIGPALRAWVEQHDVRR